MDNVCIVTLSFSAPLNPLKYVGLILIIVCVCVCVCHPTHLYTMKAMKAKAAANRMLAVTTTLVALGDVVDPERDGDQVE